MQCTPCLPHTLRRLKQESKDGGLQGRSDRWERSTSTRMIRPGRSSGSTRAGRFPTDQSSCGTLGTARRKNEGLSGDQSLAHSGGGERFLNGWGRDGHRRRLGGAACGWERVVTIHRRTNSTSSELVFTGEIVLQWNEDFTALWNKAMDGTWHTSGRGRR